MISAVASVKQSGYDIDTMLKRIPIQIETEDYEQSMVLAREEGTVSFAALLRRLVKQYIRVQRQRNKPRVVKPDESAKLNEVDNDKS